MALTTFAPDDTYTAGNTVINVMPAVANITSPTLTEWNAGTVIQCATEAFEPSLDTKTNTRKKLCDKESVEIPGTATFSISDITIVSDNPQGEAPYPAIFVPGATVFIGVRPGMDHASAAAAAQKVWVFEAQFQDLVPTKITTDEGEAFGWTLKFLARDHTYKAALVAP